MTIRVTEKEAARLRRTAQDGQTPTARAARRPRAQRPAGEPTEAQTQAAILDWLAWHGYPAARTQAGAIETASGHYARQAPEGWPDITACVDGRFVAIECKAPRGRLRPSQVEMRARLEAAGALYIVARSVEDVEAALGVAL